MTDVVLLGEGFGLEDDEGEASQVSLLELAQPPLAERVQLLRHLRIVLAVLHLDLVLVIFLRKMKIKIIFLRKMKIKILHLDRHVEDVRWLPALASLQLRLFNGTDPESKPVLRDKYMKKVLRDKYVTKVLRDKYVTKVLRDKYVTKVLRDKYVKKVLRDKYVTKVLRDKYVIKGCSCSEH